MSRGKRGQTTLDFAFGMSVFLVVVIFTFLFVPAIVAPFETQARESTAAADRIANRLVGGVLGVEGERYKLDRRCTIVFFESNTSFDPGGDDGENLDDDGVYSEPYDLGAGGAAPSDCGFEDVPLNERLGLTRTQNVHVRLIADLDENTSRAQASGPAAVDPGLVLDAKGPGVPNENPDELCLDANDPRIVEAANATVDDDNNNGSSDTFEVACDIAGGDDDVLFSVGPRPPESSASIIVARRSVVLEGGFADGNDDAVLVVEVW